MLRFDRGPAGVRSPCPDAGGVFACGGVSGRYATLKDQINSGTGSFDRRFVSRRFAKRSSQVHHLHMVVIFPLALLPAVVSVFVWAEFAFEAWLAAEAADTARALADLQVAAERLEAVR